MSSEDARRKRPHIREFSFGGVVVRRDESSGRHEVIAIVPRGKKVLALPKGGANPEESGEETAAREVREETGVTATVVDHLGDVNYWYRRGGRSVYKTVRFFLCEYVSGSTDDHDHEVEEARWIPLEEAPRRLAFPGERRMVGLAARRLAGDEPNR